MSAALQDAVPPATGDLVLTSADLAAMRRDSLAFFASDVLRGPNDPPYNGKFIIAEHHEEWASLVEQNDRLCIIAARGHGKSHFFSLALPIWDALYHPGGMDPPDCVIFSASQRQAERLLKKIKVQVENNSALRHLFPAKAARDHWSASLVRLANGYTIAAQGFGTKVRGGHPRLVVVDDGFHDNTAHSEIVRNKEIDYFFEAIRPMIMPGGKIVVVGTPLHSTDLYAKLEKNTEYSFAKYPAVQKGGKPLWPEVHSLASLEATRREVGEVSFTREFLCQPIGDGSSLFPSHLFRGEPTEQYTVRLGMPRKFWEDAGVSDFFVGVDFGLSSSIGSDYTVVFVMGIDGRGNRWIVDIIRERGLEYGAQKGLIVAASRRYRPGVVYVESNQAQRIFGDELIRETDLPIKKFHTGESKHSEQKGLPGMRIMLENRKFRIPRGDERSVAATDEWIKEMGEITIHKGRVISLGEHDDMAVASWICERAIREGAFAYSFGEEEGDVEAADELWQQTMVDEEHEDYLGEDDYVLGALPQGRGRPRKVNAQLVDDPGDDLKRLPSTSPRRTKGFGSPTAAELLLFGGGS